jgi:NADH-quinone oxidoreductase subunit N
MFYIKEFFFLIPELFLLFTSVLLMILYPLTLRPYRIKIFGTVQRIHLNSIVEFKMLLILAYVATFWLLLLTINTLTEPILLFQQQYFISNTTQICKCLIIITIIILLIIAPFQRQFTYWEEHIILTVFIVISGLFMISANDYLILWLSAEFQSFCFIIGITFFRNGERALEGGTYYFVTSAVMSSFFLLGIWLIYGVTGTINLSTLSLFMTRDFILLNYPVITLGALFILSYFFFKIAVAPFHIWSLHVFTTSNLFIVYQLAIISKLSAILPFFQTITLFLSKHTFWFLFCILLSLFSIAYRCFCVL